MNAEYETGRCVIGSKEHQADNGTLICRRHLEDLGKMLRAIEEEAIQLETTPTMAVSNERSGGTLASHLAPARIDAVVLRDPRRGTGTPLRGEPDPWGFDDTPSVLDVLASWARVVRDDRDLAPPDRVTVTGERDLLTRQLLWIAEQLWVDEFHDELRDLLRVLRRTNSTQRLPVGTCETLQPDGNLCDGKVWHVLIKPDCSIERAADRPGRDDEPGFRCGKCRRVWTGTEAVRLRDRMWRDEQERKAAS